MRAALISICLVVVLFAPSVSAVKIFGNDDVYTVYYDESVFEKVKPAIIGEQPEIIYWRLMEVQGEPNFGYLVMMLFWEHQYHYIADHDYDWEWYCVKFDSNGYAIVTAFPEWHYVIGRGEVPTMYNKTHTAIHIGEDNHPVTMFSDYITDLKLAEALNYSDSEVEELDNSIGKRAAEEVGFDEKLIGDPKIFFEEGWFGYKRYSAFRSWRRSFMVYIDRKLDWVDYGEE